MKLIYTEQALESLEEALAFISSEVSPAKLIEIRDKIIARARRLIKSPQSAQKEEYLKHLGLEHRRIIEGNYKIIYRIEEKNIYITDIFDTLQYPAKMKG